MAARGGQQVGSGHLVACESEASLRRANGPVDCLSDIQGNWKLRLPVKGEAFRTGGFSRALIDLYAGRIGKMIGLEMELLEVDIAANGSAVARAQLRWGSIRDILTLRSSIEVVSTNQLRQTPLVVQSSALGWSASPALPVRDLRITRRTHDTLVMRDARGLVAVLERYPSSPSVPKPPTSTWNKQQRGISTERTPQGRERSAAKQAAPTRTTRPTSQQSVVDVVEFDQAVFMANVSGFELRTSARVRDLEVRLARAMEWLAAEAQTREDDVQAVRENLADIVSRATPSPDTKRDAKPSANAKQESEKYDELLARLKAGEILLCNEILSGKEERVFLRERLDGLEARDLAFDYKHGETDAAMDMLSAGTRSRAEECRLLRALLDEADLRIGENEVRVSELADDVRRGSDERDAILTRLEIAESQGLAFAQRIDATEAHVGEIGDVRRGLQEVDARAASTANIFAEDRELTRTRLEGEEARGLAFARRIDAVEARAGEIDDVRKRLREVDNRAAATAKIGSEERGLINARLGMFKGKLDQSDARVTEIAKVARSCAEENEKERLRLEEAEARVSDEATRFAEERSLISARLETTESSVSVFNQRVENNEVLSTEIAADARKVVEAFEVFRLRFEDAGARASVDAQRASDELGQISARLAELEAIADRSRGADMKQEARLGALEGRSSAPEPAFEARIHSLEASSSPPQAAVETRPRRLESEVNDAGKFAGTVAAGQEALATQIGRLRALEDGKVAGASMVVDTTAAAELEDDEPEPPESPEADAKPGRRKTRWLPWR